MHIPLLLMGILGVGALSIPGISTLRRREGSILYAGITMGAIALSMVTVTLLQFVFRLQESDEILETALFRVDIFGSFLTLVVLGVALLVAVVAIDYMRNDPNSAIFYSMLLFASLGMVLLTYSVDLLVIIIAWELMSIPTFVMTGFKKDSLQSNESAIKFFILGALSSGILLYAISLVYGLTGSTNLYAVLQGFGSVPSDLSPLASISLILFIAGFGLKLSAVPFHMWSPDALEGAPTPTSTLLAAATKKAGFAVALRVLAISFILFHIDWTLAFAVLAILSMTLGNIAALTQKSITRLLAYSSIAQAGFIMIGFAVAFVPLGLIAAVFHIFTHALMKSGAFIAVASVNKVTSNDELSNYDGLGRRMPIAAFAITISFLALAGVPPLNGFWSKLLLFTAALNAGSIVWWAPWLAIAAALNSALSLGYYAWVIKRMYLDEPQSDLKVKEQPSYIVPLLITTTLIVLTGIYWNPILTIAADSVLGLLLPR